MADVRSLLRNELAARGNTTKQSGNKVTTKKRKIDAEDDIPASKRSKQAEEIESVSSKTDLEGSRPSLEQEEKDSGRKQKKVRIAENLEEDDSSAAVPAQPEPVVETTPSKESQGQTQPSVDEDEWAAFEREVVAPTRVPQASSTSMPAAVNSSATISAAPVSASEMAAQQEADENAEKGQEDVKGEVEDAARYLEEEFDEMEELEERVRKLKEKREELRKKWEATEEREGTEESAGTGGVQDREEVASAEKVEQGDEGESDEDDDEWDDWRFR